LYKDVCSDSPAARGLSKLVIKCLTDRIPLIIRNFKGKGGIGRSHATQTADGFLKFHEDIRSPDLYCHLRGQPNGTKQWKELREEFDKSPGSCAYIANLLGIPLGNYHTLSTNLSFPKFLEPSDLLRRAATKCNNFEKLQEGLRVVPELAFGVVDMEDSYTSSHEDQWPTFKSAQVKVMVWACFTGDRLGPLIICALVEPNGMLMRYPYCYWSICQGWSRSCLVMG
jgi:hypothetical protein